MAVIPSHPPDGRNGYVSVPNGLANRAANTMQFDPQVFEASGEYVPPAPTNPEPQGVLGTGLSPGQVSLALSVAFLAWRVL